MVAEVQVLEVGGKPGLMLFFLRQQPAQTLLPQLKHFLPQLKHFVPQAQCVAAASALLLLVTAEFLTFRLRPAPAGWRGPGAECRCH